MDIENKYEFVKQIGERSFGTVFKAKYKDNFYAVKRQYYSDEKEKQFILIEFRALLIARHKNILHVHDIVVGSDYIDIVTDYLPKGDLSRRKITSEEELKACFRDISAGVAYLHSIGILHRDLKSTNVLEGKDGFVISDFGLSKNKSEIRNTYCGTFEYMAPEIRAKKAYDESVDIWALGTMIYEFCYEDPKLLYTAEVYKGKFPRAKLKISSELKEMIRRCLEKNPEKRPKAQEVADFFSGKQFQSENDDCKLFEFSGMDEIMEYLEKNMPSFK